MLKTPQQPVELLPPPERPRKMGLGGRLAVWVTAGSLSVGGAMEASGISPVDIIHELNPPECTFELNPQVLSTVQAIIDKAQPTNETRVNTDKPPHRLLPEYKKRVAEAAERAGFTLIDPDPYIQRLAGTTTNTEILAIINELTMRYGFPTKFLHADGKTVSSGGPELDDLMRGNGFADKAFAQKAAGFMEQFYSRPVEYIRLTGIEELQIAKNARETHEVAVANGNTGVVRMNIFSLGELGLLEHELAHLKDFKDCGIAGSRNDPVWTALNPPGTKYGDEERMSETAKIPPQRLVADPRGNESAGEDKAAVAAAVANGLSNRLLDLRHDPITEKAVVWMTRLEQELKGYTTYWEAIGYQPTYVHTLNPNDPTVQQEVSNDYLVSKYQVG